MPNLYGDSVLPPSELLFKSCLESRMFPSEWKKTHVVLVHKNFGKHFFKHLSAHSITLYLLKNISTTDVPQNLFVLSWKQFNFL